MKGKRKGGNDKGKGKGGNDKEKGKGGNDKPSHLIKRQKILYLTRQHLK